MSNEVRDDRLAFELEEMKRLTQESSLIEYKANDEYFPDQYYVRFHCLGLAQKDLRINEHVVHIYLPAEYPRTPPGIRFKTRIFHPNIKARVGDDKELANLAETVGGIESLGRLYESNPVVRQLFEAYICLDVLGPNWAPNFTLYDICLELGGMIQFQRFNLDDPLNTEAVEWTKWARTQRGLLPIDSRDLRDRLRDPIVRDIERHAIRILKVEKV
jgi:ubiquitin-protein ligase